MGKKVIIAHDDLDLGSLNNVEGSWSVKTTDNGTEALNLIQRFRDGVVAVVIDLDLPKGEALAVLRELRRGNPELPIVALTRSDRPAEAAVAVGAGATECAFKPIAHEDLIRILQRVTKSDAIAACEPAARKPPKSEFLHLSPEMREIQQSLQMLAPWDVPVVFTGETGVGKEVAARELHRLSTRAHKPFIKINCAAVPSELLESELFGYEKGAFTGALRSKPGKFELADGGTVLLDEIGDMHSNLQAKLLHVLQDGEFDRLGARQSMHVDVRVLAATHRDLRRNVETGSFREDLFYRLNVASVHIPALRERKDEIVPLAQRFIIKHSKPDIAQLPEIPMSLRQALIDYPWPGNVRELENVIRKFLVFRQPDTLAAELWKRTVESGQAPRSVAMAKVKPGSVRTPALVRNGTNGHGNVTPLSANGFGNGATTAAGVPAGMRNGWLSENGVSHREEFHQGLHAVNGNGNGNGNGHVKAYSNGSAAADTSFNGQVSIKTDTPVPQYESREQNGHAFGTMASSSSVSVYDDEPHLNGTGNGLVHNGGPSRESRSDFNGSDQVSTLAQVEELSREFERRTILAALERSTWNRKKAAKLLEIDYKGLLYKMKKLEIGQAGASD